MQWVRGLKPPFAAALQFRVCLKDGGKSVAVNCWIEFGYSTVCVDSVGTTMVRVRNVFQSVSVESWKRFHFSLRIIFSKPMGVFVSSLWCFFFTLINFSLKMFLCFSLYFFI